MIMVDQSKRLSEPILWGRRERSVIAVLLACVVLAVIGLGAYALTSGAPKRAGCIELTFASTLGGARLHACGKRARAMCAAPSALESRTGSLRDDCRAAGYPYATQ
jgi:hypothetical protein